MKLTKEYYSNLYKPGTKVKLIEMVGELQMPTGLIGTVVFVDDYPQIHVRWENGSGLALDPEADKFQII